MALTGFIVQSDLDQLPVLSGSAANLKWLGYNPADGKLYQITASQLIGVGGGNLIARALATAGTVTNVAALAGKTVNAVFRGGFGMGAVVSVAPNGSEVQWDSVSANLTVPENQDWAPNEQLMIFYTN